MVVALSLGIAVAGVVVVVLRDLGILLWFGVVAVGSYLSFRLWRRSAAWEAAYSPPRDLPAGSVREPLARTLLRITLTLSAGAVLVVVGAFDDPVFAAAGGGVATGRFIASARLLRIAHRVNRRLGLLLRAAPRRWVDRDPPVYFVIRRIHGDDAPR